MDKKDVIDLVALDLGFVADKYYTAKDKMLLGCKTDGNLTMGCLV